MTLTTRETAHLYAQAREALINLGHSSVRRKKDTIKLAAQELGVEGLNNNELLKQFLLKSATRYIASPTRLVKNRFYKYDRAMIEAIKRIPPDYPLPISMVSSVKGFQNGDMKK